MKKLNDTQVKQLQELISHYKYFYICNLCGSVYGTDYSEKKEHKCHLCEVKERKE